MQNSQPLQRSSIMITLPLVASIACRSNGVLQYFIVVPFGQLTPLGFVARAKGKPHILPGALECCEQLRSYKSKHYTMKMHKL